MEQMPDDKAALLSEGLCPICSDEVFLLAPFVYSCSNDHKYPMAITKGTELDRFLQGEIPFESLLESGMVFGTNTSDYEHNKQALCNFLYSTGVMDESGNIYLPETYIRVDPKNP